MDIADVLGTRMGIEFDCSCGERITETTRGKQGEVPGVQLACSNCDSLYVVTITRLTSGVQTRFG